MNSRKLLSVITQHQLKLVRHASWVKSIFKVDKFEPPYGHVVQVGDPVLRKVADEIPKNLITSPEIKFLVKQMKNVLDDYSLVGLAAPQVGISLRVFIISFGEHLKEKFTPEIYKAKEMSTLPYTIFINPKLKFVDRKQVVFEEGCASIVGLVAEIARNYSVEVTSLDLEGKEQKHLLSGWNARIAQHENDHLNGILFTDIMDRKTLRCTNWQVVNAKCGRIVIPYYPKK